MSTRPVSRRGKVTKHERCLVLEHLENVSWRLFEAYPDLVKEIIRGRHGVYALYRKDRLYYVGLAKNLMARLRSHIKDRHQGLWDRFSVYLTVHDQHIKEMESLILRITVPSGNRMSGKFVSSSNLYPKLNQLMCDADADQRARLLGGRVAARRRRIKTAKAKGTRVLSGVVDRRLPLRAGYKDAVYKATLRTDGWIRCGNAIFDSPTGAAKAILGRNVNGWVFWKYRNAKKEWVPLRDLRK
ncbi:MAG: hypothetical protein ACE15D_16855 [Candidatus Eisenbacteria bacterium]